MGLFDKAKKVTNQAIGAAKNIDKEVNKQAQKRNEQKELKKQKKIDEILIENNIFEGIKVNAVFPDKELKIQSHGGLTKGAATLGFGLVGLAATSGVKQKEQRRTLKNIIFQVAEKGVVFKNAALDGKDLRIPYENIVSLKIATIKFGKKENVMKGSLILNLLENQEIGILLLGLRGEKRDVVTNKLLEVINERARGIENEESGWGLPSENIEQIEENSQPDHINELEKIMNMYEKGLLTEEEFITMKKKIIEK